MCVAPVWRVSLASHLVNCALWLLQLMLKAIWLWKISHWRKVLSWQCLSEKLCSQAVTSEAWQCILPQCPVCIELESVAQEGTSVSLHRQLFPQEKDCRQIAQSQLGQILHRHKVSVLYTSEKLCWTYLGHTWWNKWQGTLRPQYFSDRFTRQLHRSIMRDCTLWEALYRCYWLEKRCYKANFER